MSDLPLSTIKSIVFGDDNMGLDKSADDLDEQPDPMQAFILQNQVRAALGKSSGTSVVLDMSVPADDVDSEDNSLFWKAPRIVRYNPDALKKTSGKKFVELLALVRKVFDGHEEEYQEVVEIVTRAREDARAEAIARM